MTKPLAPFRFDIVGSFLRPDYLKEARAQFAAGNITQEELTAIEENSDVPCGILISWLHSTELRKLAQSIGP